MNASSILVSEVKVKGLRIRVYRQGLLSSLHLPVRGTPLLKDVFHQSISLQHGNMTL